MEVEATNLRNHTAERNKRKQRKRTVLSRKLVLTTEVIRAVIATKKATEELKNMPRLNKSKLKKAAKLLL